MPTSLSNGEPESSTDMINSPKNSDLSAKKRPSIDKSEIEKFRAMASEWWDPKGKFKPLHKFNPVRLAFLRDRITSHFDLDDTNRSPLQGLRILDIGCGGGLVSEPMARLGAQMTSVDAGEANIKTAMLHAREMGIEIDYRVGTAEELIEANEEKFDVVLNLEVIEHVADAEQFIKDTSSLVKPGGLIFVASINRTTKAFALAILGAEYIMGWLPKGTHEFHKLVKPDEVKSALTSANITLKEITGVSFNPLSGEWSLSSDTLVNYMCVGTKP